MCVFQLEYKPSSFNYDLIQLHNKAVLWETPSPMGPVISRDILPCNHATQALRHVTLLTRSLVFFLSTYLFCLFVLSTSLSTYIYTYMYTNTDVPTLLSLILFTNFFRDVYRRMCSIYKYFVSLSLCLCLGDGGALRRRHDRQTDRDRHREERQRTDPEASPAKHTVAVLF